MKNGTLLLFVFLVFPLTIFAQWTYQYPGFSEHYEINYVDVVNENVVWAVAKDQSGNNLAPMFSVTETGDDTWQSGYITQDEGLAPAMIYGSGLLPYAFAALYKTYESSSSQAGLYATFDFGLTWERQAGVFDDPAAFPDIVHFWNAGQGVAIGDPIDDVFDIYTTNNYGNTWTKLPQANIPAPLPSEYALIGNFDVFNSAIWFSTTKGRVFRSENRGTNWEVFNSPFSSFTKVNFRDANIGWLQDVGQWEFSQIAKTTDGGETWQLIAHNGPLLNWDLDYIPGSATTLVSSGAYLNNGITMSYDGGDNWYYFDQPGIKFFKMDWYDWQTGWVGGYNDNLQVPFLFKYTGPGVGDYIVYPLFIDFGDVEVGVTNTRSVQVTNLGLDVINLANIYTNTGYFQVSPSSGSVDPEGGEYQLEVSFTPDGEGYFEDMVIIESNHPWIPSVTVNLAGTGFIPETNIVFNPESYNETLYTGQTITETLSVTNNSGSDINYQVEVTCDLSLGVLGWNSGSTPLDSDNGILAGDYDQAMFIKEFTVGEFTNSTLYLGVDDGCRFWVNGNLVLDDLHGSHGVEYWNYVIDILPYLTPGVNRVSGVVFNGIFGGGGTGGFDCEVVVDDVAVIKRGIDNYNTPEAIWYYFGQSGQQLVPDVDVNGKNWWEAGYGQYDWVLLDMQTEQSLEGLGRNYLPAPFGGYVLGSAPDNAQFIKDIYVGEYSWAMLYLGFDDGCRVWINGSLVLDYHLEDHNLNYWDHEDDISGLLINGRNRISVEVYNGIYSGFGTGNFDCQLIVDDVELIKRGDENPGAPEAMWYVYGSNGIVQTPPADGQHEWFDVNYGTAGSSGNNYLSNLNWNFDSTPFVDRADILASSPDNAQFIKDFTMGEFSWATLLLAFDDGCRVWLNGNLVLDYSQDVHNMNYWDREDDVTTFLLPSRNRISVEVYNGIYGGGGGGGFDCELIVDDVAVIKRGDENFGQPEAMWYFYGQVGQVLTPPLDLTGLEWFEKDYGISQATYSNSLSGSIANGQTQEFEVLIDAAGLSSGEYQTNIRFTSENTEDETLIPVTLFVNSEGYLTITPSALNFGDFYLGYPETLTLNLKNNGFEILDIISIWSNSPDISTDLYEYSLAPGESVALTVTLDSYEEGPFNSTLNLQTTSYSSVSKVLSITANRMWAPSLVIENLEYMYAYLASGQTETQNLHIDNWGGSPLIFTIPQAQSKDEKAGIVKTQMQPFKPSQKQQPVEVKRTKEPAYYQNNITGHKNLVVNNDNTNNPKASDAAQIDLFNDDMENGGENWTIENYGEGKSQWHQVKFYSFSPETSWWCGDELTGTYLNGYAVREAIITPTIKLPNIESVITLEFNEWYNIEGGFDQCFVDVNLDGGYDWIRIREGNPGFSDGWLTTTLDISQFYGSEIKVRFFFDTGDNIANDFPGWFVDDVRIYTEGITFLSMTPGEGAVGVNEGFDITVTFDASGYDAGYYPGFILFQTNDPVNNWFYLPAIMEVYEGGNYQSINLPAGWSGVSSYLSPDTPQLDQLFSPVSGDLVILQNLESVYWPSEGINTIGDWNYLNGYSVKLNNSTSLDIFGTIPENLLIEMPVGWSLIPVLSFNPVPVTDFDPLESLNIIKEAAGTGVYWPVYNINTLQELQPGKSYLINVSGDESFEYPPMIKSAGFKPISQPEALISPWNEVVRTPSTHLIAVPSKCLTTLSAGDVLGIFNEVGYCAGFTTINNNSQNQSITAFGDDPTTSAADGLTPDEPMIFKLMKSATSETIDIGVTFSNMLPNQGDFANNGLSAITGIKLGELTISEYSQTSISIQPNPVVDVLKISSVWPVSRIEINDSKGVLFLASDQNQESELELALSSLPDGMYYVKIITTHSTVIKKVLKQ